jgi:hypothetical protein
MSFSFSDGCDCFRVLPTFANNDQIHEKFTPRSSPSACAFLRRATRARLSNAQVKVCRPGFGTAWRDRRALVFECACASVARARTFVMPDPLLRPAASSGSEPSPSSSMTRLARRAAQAARSRAHRPGRVLARPIWAERKQADSHSTVAKRGEGCQACGKGSECQGLRHWSGRARFGGAWRGRGDAKDGQRKEWEFREAPALARAGTGRRGRYLAAVADSPRHVSEFYVLDVRAATLRCLSSGALRAALCGGALEVNFSGEGRVCRRQGEGSREGEGENSLIHGDDS